MKRNIALLILFFSILTFKSPTIGRASHPKIADETIMVYLPVIFNKSSSDNQLPNAPTNPFPADNATDQSLDITLSWTSTDPDGDEVIFDIYFEAEDASPDILVSDDQPDLSYPLSGLSANTHYYWQIVVKDEHGATRTGSVWDFITGDAPNQPPNAPTNPFPADNATDQSLDITLSWTSTDPDGDEVTFDIYFEAEDATPDILVSDDQPDLSYPLSGLSVNTHYYWQIVVKDEHGATRTGSVWNFFTGDAPNQPPNAPTNPFPADNATDQSLDITLSWTSTDPDGDEVTFDIYFEAEDASPDILVSDDQPDLSYPLSGLSVNTHYYWQIVVKDEHGATRTGSVWDFITGDAPNQPPNAPTNPFPADNATDQSLDITLSWTSTDPDGDEVTFDIYFEAEDATPDILVSDDQSSAVYNPGSLNPNTQYYWQIISSEIEGASTAGPVWNFITGNYDPPPTGMVFVPAGEFQMGCDQNVISSCGSDELPLHTIYLDPYYIDQYEVTNTQYSECVAAGDCTLPYSDASFTRESYYSNPSFAHFPVLYVNWNQAITFCSWAGKRLPTEAEWEKAARGSNDTRTYPWGNTKPECAMANYALSGANVHCVGDTSQVGDYPSGSSPYSVFDIAGNVLEWVNDWYQSDYYTISPSTNPSGPLSGTKKVMRGGSWSLGVDGLKVLNRINDFSGHHGPSVGFRCAQDSPISLISH